MEYSFNRAISMLAPSSSIALMDQARAMKAAGKDIINLAGGEPDFDTPAQARLAGIRAITEGKTHYTAGRGILPLRQAISQKLANDNGILRTPDEVLVTPGGKLAIYLAVRTLINPGDEVLLFDPGWVSYAPIVIAAGGTPVRVQLSHLDNYTITRERLDKAVTPQSRLMILNTPNNPTGRMITKAEADAVAACIERNNLMLIADEIYEKIVFDGNVHISLGADPRVADRVVTINGLSKCAAMTGWRIGYLAAAKPVVDMIYMLYQHAVTCVSEFSQLAAIEAMRLAPEIERMRADYQNRRDVWIPMLREVRGTTCLVPEGAFYLWMRFPMFKDSGEVCRFLLEQAGVVAVPGDAYGAPGEDCFIRMSFATAAADLREAAVRMQRALN